MTFCTNVRGKCNIHTSQWSARDLHLPLLSFDQFEHFTNQTLKYMIQWILFKSTFVLVDKEPSFFKVRFGEEGWKWKGNEVLGENWGVNNQIVTQNNSANQNGDTEQFSQSSEKSKSCIKLSFRQCAVIWNGYHWIEHELQLNKVAMVI